MADTEIDCTRFSRNNRDSITNVAAMEEQQEELGSLRKQLSFCRRVEILDDHTKRALAQGQLEDGSYESGGRWFRVKLKVPPQDNSEDNDGEDKKSDGANGEDINNVKISCPLRDLCNLRICVGGLHQGQLSSGSDFRPDFTYTEGNSETTKGILLTAQSQQLAIHMVIQGWPNEDWSGGINFETNGNKKNNTQQQQPQDALDFLSVTLPMRYPDATVSFESVDLFSDRNQGVIQNLPKAIREKLEHGLEEAQAKFLFMKLVTNRLRFVLDEDGDNHASLAPQVKRVVEALNMLDISSIEQLATASTKETMEYIIQMHKVSRESSNPHHFEECVNGLLVQKQNKEERQRRKSETMVDVMLNDSDSD